ncbi:hypothetical protein NE237_026744 [Protea cynaroides]|uniref:Uncharacterized protein n=1 Tax=Protea cynaroides TaxID=273540 RepID=A0A9Q0JTD3_9MAGN|nr:hypothetical protein NE237_016367 [Protea cynaroides]KAJ4949770.1 hypothetical protein NE237_026744 [Protea cynaroides]
MSSCSYYLIADMLRTDQVQPKVSHHRAPCFEERTDLTVVTFLLSSLSFLPEPGLQSQSLPCFTHSLPSTGCSSSSIKNETAGNLDDSSEYAGYVFAQGQLLSNRSISGENKKRIRPSVGTLERLSQSNRIDRLSARCLDLRSLRKPLPSTSTGLTRRVADLSNSSGQGRPKERFKSSFMSITDERVPQQKHQCSSPLRLLSDCFHRR